MNLVRELEISLKEKLIKGKVLILLGQRRVGKTVLLKKLLDQTNEKYLLFNGEDISVQELLSRRSVQHYQNIIGDNSILAIDEAQNIKEIGSILKLIVDSFLDLKIIVTGSSGFNLTEKTSEPLTGRKNQLFLFPFTEYEFLQIEKPNVRFDKMKDRLVFGSMPELVNLQNSKQKADYLRLLVDSYLIKDILSFEALRNSSKILYLLKLIAYQIGKDVSLSELGSQLSMSKNTIERYLDLLSKVFVVYRHYGFSKNLRKEVVKNQRWYFYDNGILNAIIANFNPLEMRNDIGQLWENFMISERMKRQAYDGFITNNYYWRTYDKQEIDLIEERGGKLYAYEFKWKEQKTKIPEAWKKSYQDSEFKQINSNNYSEWLKPNIN
ncbi:MAG: ATP-binding protein [Melioribacteraceae bacterium]|nr:ATP-binding protein [Melioribacteraceae bacterium]